MENKSDFNRVVNISTALDQFNEFRKSIVYLI